MTPGRGLQQFSIFGARGAIYFISGACGVLSSFFGASGGVIPGAVVTVLGYGAGRGPTELSWAGLIGYSAGMRWACPIAL